MPKITENMWRDHLAMIGAGKLDTRKAAKSLGCSMRAVQKRMEAAGIKVPAPAPPPKAVSPAPSPDPSPGSPKVASPSPEGKTELERALAAATASGGSPDASGSVIPSPGDVAGAKDKMETFCVDTLNTLKGLSVTALAQYKFKINPDEPRIARVKKLGTPAEAVVRVNCDKLYPYLFKLMSGWGPVAGFLALDLLQGWATVKAVAIEKGWKPPKPRGETETEEPRKEPAATKPAPSSAPPAGAGGPKAPDVRPVHVAPPGWGGT